MNEIICRTCRESRSESDFYKRNTKSGRTSECKACTKKRASDWYYANHERATARNRAYHHRNKSQNAARHRKRLYGLLPEEAEEMLLQQQDRCAICQEARPLVVDHCHESGEVRALLCNRCNSAIGYFNENVALIRRAVEYIIHHQERIAQITSQMSSPSPDGAASNS